ncbi:MAG: putative DNA modification/repair radical SAM protein [Firmicutes bacterium]|nr:putative DNA modification/repair radical SAM protein [Bacillota bacterium]
MEATIMQKLKILADSAKYDVSCSSSGASRYNNGRMGNAHMAGICHSWGADGRCISLLKVLFTNKCEYDCEYCVNRRSNDFPRASFEPEELARLTVEFYRRNYIEGLFLSSAVEISPDHTAEKILESLELLRYKYGFAGYIHAKIIPGVSPEILHRIGLVADRLSVNIELPSSKSLGELAPQKKVKQIFEPMRQITNTLIEHKSLVGPGTMFKGQKLNTPENYLGTPTTGFANADGQSEGTAGRGKPAAGPETSVGRADEAVKYTSETARYSGPALPEFWDQVSETLPAPKKGAFAAAGQTTQMIIGAGGESDKSILTTSENLYHAFKMKRVYYSAYIPAVKSPKLPDLGTPVPLAREHRIYQADWLLRFYGFTVSELFQDGSTDLDPDLDPKVTWAIRNLDAFPIEINTASYEQLMRIPGIGHTSAMRIIRQRRYAAVRFDDLKKIGVVLKRAKYFILCCGRYYGDRKFEPETIRNSILQMEEGLQMSMFDQGGLSLGTTAGSVSALETAAKQSSAGALGTAAKQNSAVALGTARVQEATPLSGKAAAI